MDHGMDPIAVSILQKIFLAGWKTNSNIPKPPTVLRSGSNSPGPSHGLEERSFVAVAGFALSGLSVILETAKSVCCFRLISQ